MSSRCLLGKVELFIFINGIYIDIIHLKSYIRLRIELDSVEVNTKKYNWG